MPRLFESRPLFVGRLFALLHSLGIEQQAIVRALGASKPLVSYWATGKRPMAPHWQAPFLRYVQRAIFDVEWLPDPPDPAPWERYERLNGHLTDWWYEVLQGWKWIDRQMDGFLATITAFRGQTTEKLTDEELQQIEKAAAAWLRYKRRRDLVQQQLPGPPADVGLRGRSESPLVYLQQIIDVLGIAVELPWLRELHEERAKGKPLTSSEPGGA
jgi:hypothetical protein